MTTLRLLPLFLVMRIVHNLGEVHEVAVVGGVKLVAVVAVTIVLETLVDPDAPSALIVRNQDMCMTQVIRGLAILIPIFSPSILKLIMPLLSQLLIQHGIWIVDPTNM